MFPELAAKIIFIGGLPLETRKSDLFEYLSLYSEVDWLSMGQDKVTGEFRGFAYLLLADELKASDLLEKKFIDFKGVKVGIQRWKASCDYISDKDSSLKRKVFLKGLGELVNEAELKEYFSKFGTVEYAEIRRDHLTKESRRIGFILFENEASATSCLAKKNHFLKSRRIYCKECKSKREKTQLQENQLNNCSNKSSNRWINLHSNFLSPNQLNKSAVLGPEALSTIDTKPPSIQEVSTMSNSDQDKLNVLDQSMVRIDDSLGPKPSTDKTDTLPALGFCAHRSDNSVSTASNQGLCAPKAHKSKQDLSRLLFSEPFIPALVDQRTKNNKPIQIEYFTLPGNI
jgi:RNA recognition motif-containing protein